MALTRKFLSALGIEADKVDEIIAAHSETVNGLKTERDEFKTKAENLQKDSDELESVKAELEELKKSTQNTGDKWKSKYDDLKSEYDNYKNDVEAKATKQAKTDAYKGLLKEANISEKRLDSILKISAESIDGIEIGEDGKVKGSDKLVEKIKEEWADFVVTEGSTGVNTATPPSNKMGEQHKVSRAAKLAANYHNNLYGENKEG